MTFGSLGLPNSFGNPIRPEHKSKKIMERKTIVKYIKPYAPYKIGDICGVSDAEAATLIDAGVVKYFETPPTNKAVEMPPVAKEVTPKPKARRSRKK